MEYTVGSLFAGVGGICLGFKNAKMKDYIYKLSWANEIDEYAIATYKNNFKHSIIAGDIEKIVKPERENKVDDNENYYSKRNDILGKKIDILTAGFPCQSFSIAGYRKGFDDHRGNLFWSIVDLINLLSQKYGEKNKPQVLFLENVKNLKSHDKGRTYAIIKNEIEKLGYTVKEKVLNTKDFSTLPQNRERIYIVAFLDSKVAENFRMFDDDVINNFMVKRESQHRIEDIEKVIDFSLTKKVAEKYYYTKEKYPHYFLTEEEYFAIDPDQRRDNRINIEEEITEKYQFYQVRRGMYVRKNMNGVCPTLTANMGTGGHNVPLIKVDDGIRKLTPAETFKLQGFPIGNGYELPAEYKGKKITDSRFYKQAGNAVSVDVITLIATEILRALYVTNEERNKTDKENLVLV